MQGAQAPCIVTCSSAESRRPWLLPYEKHLAKGISSG